MEQVSRDPPTTSECGNFTAIYIAAPKTLDPRLAFCREGQLEEKEYETVVAELNIKNQVCSLFSSPTL